MPASAQFPTNGSMCPMSGFGLDEHALLRVTQEGHGLTLCFSIVS